MELLSSYILKKFAHQIPLIVLLSLSSGCSSMLFNYMYKDMDVNSDGVVDFNEYKSGQTGISDKKIKTDFNYIDTNKDGKITRKELLNSFERKSH
jgi:Ca2+-binding EF-hand superfamily protein